MFIIDNQIWNGQYKTHGYVKTLGESFTFRMKMWLNFQFYIYHFILSGSIGSVKLTGSGRV